MNDKYTEEEFNEFNEIMKVKNILIINEDQMSLNLPLSCRKEDWIIRMKTAIITT